MDNIQDIKNRLIATIANPGDIKRTEWYNLFRNELKTILSTIDDNDRLNEKQKTYQKIDTLVNILNNKEAELLASPNEINRKINEINIDVIKLFIEDYTEYSTEFLNGEFPTSENVKLYYPEFNDPEFNSKIYSKKEFLNNKIPLMTDKYIEDARKRGFQKTPSQKFVRNYISEYTPYNGILLWHEVGVGKTCAGISIAENFRDFVVANDKKIIVLTPSETLIGNWRDEIVNIEKELKKRAEKNTKNVQCTGSKYIDDIINFDNMTIDKLKREANKLINKYYEFMGYQKLANSIEKDLKKYIIGKKNIENAKIEYIKQRFSNTVIIMDEAHFTREGGSKQDKIARPYLEMIARYALNTKLILATATPMYNISKEIVWLLNLLLWNDKRSPIEENELFEADGMTLKSYNEDLYDNQYAIERLVKKSRGYISYLRGENPFIFPLKLTPSDSNAYVPNPIYENAGGQLVEIDDDDKIKNMIFYSNNMSSWQYKQLKKYMNFPIDNEEDFENTGEGSKSFSIKPTQASNIVFPINILDSEGEFGGDIGDNGFRSCFVQVDKEKYEYSGHVENIEGRPFLHISNIHKYSSKFYNIINSILTCKGIAFVYSQFKTSGVKALALALEENGFARYVGEGKIENFLNKSPKDKFCAVNLKYYSQLNAEERKTFKQATYILLDGSMPKSQLNMLVKEVRGEGSQSNINGEFIKVILGSKVVEQGISFKRVREIHILDPWHHLNSMEQAAGRGIRNYSHMELAKPYRNVTLYLHIASLPEDDEEGVETSDERIYRRAFIKKKKMSIIERLLKTNSIDCGLNKFGNVFINEFYIGQDKNPLVNVKVIDSKGKTTYRNLYDNDNSARCDFDVCNYQCLPPAEPDVRVNSSTFNTFYAEDDIVLVKEYIKNLFIDDYVYSEEQIISLIRDMGVNLEDQYIYKALDDIINNREIVYDVYMRPGFVIDRYGKYIFQPKEFSNENLPILYRYLPNYIRKQTIDLETEYPESLKISRAKTISTTTQVTERVSEGETSGVQAFDIQFYLDQYDSISEYIEDQYDEYPKNPDASRPKMPTRNQLVMYLYCSWMETNLSYDNRTKFILNILEKHLTEGYQSPLLDIIINYYDTPKTNTYILRNRRDIYIRGNREVDSSIKDDIVGFVTYDNNKNINLYMFDRDTSQFKRVSNQIVNDRYKYLIFTAEDVSNNEVGVYGFLEIKSNVVKFNVINKLDGTYVRRYNRDGTEHKKTDRKGAVCGTAKGATSKPELLKVIHTLLDFQKYDEDSNRIPIKFKTSTNTDRSLCEEIELLLRHLEVTSEIVDKNNRYFYRIEERLIQN